MKILAILLLVTACAPLQRPVDRGSFSLDDEILKTWARKGRHPMVCTFTYDAAVYRDVTCVPRSSVPTSTL